MTLLRQQIQSWLILIGYVFSESWARSHPDLIGGFLKAGAAANAILAKSDGEWERIRPLMRVKNDRTWAVLRDRFREGIPGAGAGVDVSDAELLFTVLAETGGPNSSGGLE